MENWKTWCLKNKFYFRRLLRVLWTIRRSNQLIWKEINPEYSLERLMLKLKLQYFGYLMQRTDSLKRPSCWERLKAGGEGDHRGWDGWMASLTRWTWLWVSPGSWWWTERPHAIHVVTKSWTRQSDWAELNWTDIYPLLHCHITCCSVEDGQENEKTNHRMGENICKWYIQ